MQGHDDATGTATAEPTPSVSPWGGRLIAAMLFLIAAAAVAGTLITVFLPFRDWFMHLLMYAVIFSFFLLYLKAHGRGRPVLRFFMLFLSVSLAGFFVWILADLIPPQKVWYAGQVVFRRRVSELLAPMILLGLSAFVMILHFALVRARRPIA